MRRGCGQSRAKPRSRCHRPEATQLATSGVHGCWSTPRRAHDQRPRRAASPACREPEVQTFIGMMFRHHGADRGIFAHDVRIHRAGCGSRQAAQHLDAGWGRVVAANQPIEKRTIAWARLAQCVTSGCLRYWACYWTVPACLRVAGARPCKSCHRWGAHRHARVQGTSH
jgi:hypothetical protein